MVSSRDWWNYCKNEMPYKYLISNVVMRSLRVKNTRQYHYTFLQSSPPYIRTSCRCLFHHCHRLCREFFLEIGKYNIFEFRLYYIASYFTPREKRNRQSENREEVCRAFSLDWWSASLNETVVQLLESNYCSDYKFIIYPLMHFKSTF